MLIKVEHKQLHKQNDETVGICFVEPCAEMIPDVSGNVYNREKSEILLKGTLRSSGDQKIRWPNYSTIQTLKNISLQRWWKVGGSFVVHSIFLELHSERALQRSPEQLKRRRTLKKNMSWDHRLIWEDVIYTLDARFSSWIHFRLCALVQQLQRRFKL